MEIRDLILSATVLRAKGSFNEAIQLLEQNLQKIQTENPDLLINAYIELMYSSIEKKDKTLAIKFAKEASKIEPELPIVKKILSNY